MKRITKVPDWFELSNYDVFGTVLNYDNLKTRKERMSAVHGIEIKEELSIRKSLLKTLNSGSAFSPHQVFFYSSILEGKPRLNKNHRKIIKEGHRLALTNDLKKLQSFGRSMFASQRAARNISDLPPPLHIGGINEPISYDAVKGYSEFKKYSKELDIASDISELDYFDPLSHVCLTSIRSRSVHESLVKISLDIHLGRHRDEELIESFREMLTKARLKYSIAEPPIKSKAWVGDLKKVVNYKVLPLLDLLLWSKINGVEIKKSVLAGAVFGFERGDKEISEVELPFLNKLMMDSFDIDSIT